MNRELADEGEAQPKINILGAVEMLIKHTSVEQTGSSNKNHGRKQETANGKQHFEGIGKDRVAKKRTQTRPEVNVTHPGSSRIGTSRKSSIGRNQICAALANMLQLCFQLVGMPLVIGVKEGDPIGGGLANPAVTRTGRTTVALGSATDNAAKTTCKL